MTFLYESFQKLPESLDEGFSGTYLDGDEYILARDNDRRPVLFIKHGQLTADTNQTYRLEGIEAVLQYEASIHVERQKIDGVFALIRCISDNGQTQRYFLELVLTMIRLIGRNPSSAGIEEGLNIFVRMFALRKSPARSPIGGVLGELLFIDQHADSAFCAAAWHVRSRDVFDFVFPEYAVEVKSTSSFSRNHPVTYAQTSGLSGRDVYFLSVQLIQVAHGMSGRQLLERIAENFAQNSGEIIRLWELIGEALGSEFACFLSYNFSYADAVSSMRFYDAKLVPAVRGPLPAGVGRLTFDSDFSLAPTVDDARRLQVLGFPPE